MEQGGGDEPGSAPNCWWLRTIKIPARNVIFVVDTKMKAPINPFLPMILDVVMLNDNQVILSQAPAGSLDLKVTGLITAPD